MDIPTLKDIACKAVDNRSEDLKEIAFYIGNNPEIMFKEFLAHDRLTKFLKGEGFEVQEKTPLETAFIAKYGNGPIKVGVLCEYDALDGIGHACGHNLIAETGVGAGLGIKAAMEADADFAAKITLIVYGTPAEEGGGGKILMMQQGSFDNVDICMMSHPAPGEVPDAIWLATVGVEFYFKGRAAHAAGAPWEGINALDAAVAMYNNISVMRQQIKMTDRIHCVILSGGERPNVITDETKSWYQIRAKTPQDYDVLYDKLFKCAEAAATATGCTMTHDVLGDPRQPVLNNMTMVEKYVENAKLLKVEFNDGHLKNESFGSTDMGNVSYAIPSIHPVFKIETESTNHNENFTKATFDEENQLPTLNSAKSMAMTTIDVICEEGLLEKVKKEFEQAPPLSERFKKNH